jgi:tetratricopeptide (TPR) repeat protein
MWRARPVFISSTFLDMQAERDHLRTHVFPALEERFKGRRHFLEWVDLRLGVAAGAEADEASRELKILKVCLAEVRRSRPFLIVLLGDRYGWIPPAERIAAMEAAAAEEGFTGGVAGRSVTDLEIEFGILSDPGQAPRSFFYVREPLPYREMRPAIAARYSDAYATDAAAAERATRLAALKQHIQTTLPLRVRPYQVGWDRERQRVTGLDAFGRMVLEDIWAELAAETSYALREGEPSWQQIERDALDDFAEDCARDFVGRQAILAQLTSLCLSPVQAGTRSGICITGEAGSGKSALFGELYRRMKGADAFVLAHAAGASPQAVSVDSMLRRFVEELAGALGVAAALPESANPDTVEATFASLLGRMAAQRRVVVLVDALDQFETTNRGRFVTWLPRVWPQNARFIATAIAGDGANALAERPGIEMLPLPPLDAQEARGIIVAVCNRYRRTFELDVIEALLAKSGAQGPAWGNPLWLVLAVEELNLLDADDFARVDRSYSGSLPQRLRSLTLDIIAALPADIAGLYAQMFERAGELFGPTLARAFLGAIAISRAGWRESDFRLLLPRLSRALDNKPAGMLGRLLRAATARPRSAAAPWDELHFASLRRLFRGQIRQRGSLGQWDFNHRQMRIAVRHWLAAQRLSEIEFHVEAATHLLSLPPDDPLRESEAMVHLMGSQDWRRASQFYGDRALRPGEVEGATRVLADAVLATTPDGERPGLAKVHRLLDAAAGPRDETAGTLALRFLQQLDAMLDERASLQTRADLIIRGQRVLSNLAKADPGSAVWQRDLSLSRIKLGELLLEQGKLPEALNNFRAAHETFEFLRKAQPDNMGWPLCVGLANRRIGDVLLQQGDLDAALEHYRADYEPIARLANAVSRNAGYQKELVVAQGKIGNALLAQGKLSEALAAYRTLLEISERLAQAEPGDADWQFNISVSHDKIGTVLRKQGNLPAALESFRALLAIAEGLATADPKNLGRQYGLGNSHERVGDVLMEQGAFDTAFEHYRTNDVILLRLVKADPQNAGWQRDLGVSHEKLGEALMEQGKLQAALESFRAALAVAGALAKTDPANAGWQRDLSTVHIKIGGVLRAQRNLPEALESFRASLAIIERLAKAEPQNAGWQRDLSVSQEAIGAVLAEQGILAGALESFKASLLIRQRVAKADGSDAELQRNLAISHGNIGSVLSQQGERERALSAYEQAREIVARLKAAAPSNATLAKDLARLDAQIAALGRAG